jgi:hypothetical protein
MKVKFIVNAEILLKIVEFYLLRQVTLHISVAQDFEHLEENVSDILQAKEQGMLEV